LDAKALDHIPYLLASSSVLRLPLFSLFRLCKTEQRIVELVAKLLLSPRKARLDMTVERDNTAERLARIDKLMADMKPAPLERRATARVQAPVHVVSLPQGPALTVGRRPIA
jgi:hypothetical protein